MHQIKRSGNRLSTVKLFVFWLWLLCNTSKCRCYDSSCQSTPASGKQKPGARRLALLFQDLSHHWGPLLKVPSALLNTMAWHNEPVRQCGAPPWESDADSI